MYSRSGFTAIATFDGRVHGVVVHARNDAIASSRTELHGA
jgi:hypothetical protein